MKAFRFKLAKVLDWRIAQMELEQAKLEQLLAALADLEARQRLLAAQMAETRAELAQAAFASGDELRAHALYQARLDRTAKLLSASREEQQKAVIAQRGRYIEARRQVRLLEKLRDRHQAAWQAAADHEIEHLQADSFLARWNAQARLVREAEPDSLT
jgi:flagellar export protein FliJ